MRYLGTEFKLLFVGLGLLFVASYALSAEEELISGKVRHDAAAVLSDEARLEVALINSSAKDASSKVVASDVVPANKSGETDFVLEYQPSDINPQSAYTIQAHIIDQGKLAFVSTTEHAVLTKGFNEKVDLQLRYLHHASADGAKVTLQGDAWRLIDISGGEVSEDVKTTFVINGEGRVSGSGGCNIFHGEAKIEGNELSFGPLASTRKMCPKNVMAQEDAFFKILGSVSSYAIEKNELLLKDTSGKTILRLAQAS